MTTNQSTQKVRSSRVNNLAADTFVAPQGMVFYDTLTGALRLGDGATPGGIPIGTSGNVTARGPLGAVQFNRAGIIDGDAGLLYDAANTALSVAGNVIADGIYYANGTPLSADFSNVAASILPSATSTYDIGSTARRWATLFTNDVNATGNVGGGNVLVTGQVSAAGNVTGSYFLGNGALLTGDRKSVV